MKHHITAIVVDNNLVPAQRAVVESDIEDWTVANFSTQILNAYVTEYRGCWANVDASRIELLNMVIVPIYQGNQS